MNLNSIARFLVLDDAQGEPAVEALRGVREGMRLLLPTVPAMLIWAVATAMAMIAAGLSPFYVLLINWVVYAGSAQLAVLSMLVLGDAVVAHWWLIWLTAFVVNLRFVVFSGAVKPFFRTLPLRARLIYGFITGDVPLVIFLNHFAHTPSDPVRGANAYQRGVFIGLGLANWIAWQIGIVLGIILAAVIPNQWGLSLVASLTLLILIVKMVDNWPALVGCVSAALTAVFAHDLPNKLWIFLAIVVGVVAAMLAERFGGAIWPKNWPRKIHPTEHLEDT